ncbi:MAG: hypothetical protein ACK55Z_19890, partial [bacterium]
DLLHAVTVILASSLCHFLLDLNFALFLQIMLRFSLRNNFLGRDCIDSHLALDVQVSIRPSKIIENLKFLICIHWHHAVTLV